jgi:F-type H+-transporting ATPase subunit c
MRREERNSHMKIRNILAIMAFALSATSASAEEATTAVATATTGGEMKFLAAALGIAIAAFGGAFGQARAATAALEGIARNPAAGKGLFLPMIIGLALIESLVLYAFVISFKILG